MSGGPCERVLLVSLLPSSTILLLYPAPELALSPAERHVVDRIEAPPDYAPLLPEVPDLEVLLVDSSSARKKALITQLSHARTRPPPSRRR